MTSIDPPKSENECAREFLQEALGLVEHPDAQADIRRALERLEDDA